LKLHLHEAPHLSCVKYRLHVTLYASWNRYLSATNIRDWICNGTRGKKRITVFYDRRRLSGHRTAIVNRDSNPIDPTAHLLVPIG